MTDDEIVRQSIERFARARALKEIADKTGINLEMLLPGDQWSDPAPDPRAAALTRAFKFS